jgi:hypothetical protein
MTTLICCSRLNCYNQEPLAQMFCVEATAKPICGICHFDLKIKSRRKPPVDTYFEDKLMCMMFKKELEGATE